MKTESYAPVAGDRNKHPVYELQIHQPLDIEMCLHHNTAPYHDTTAIPCS